MAGTINHRRFPGIHFRQSQPGSPDQIFCKITDLVAKSNAWLPEWRANMLAIAPWSLPFSTYIFSDQYSSGSVFRWTQLWWCLYINTALVVQWLASKGGWHDFLATLSTKPLLLGQPSLTKRAADNILEIELSQDGEVAIPPKYITARVNTVQHSLPPIGS